MGWKKTLRHLLSGVGQISLVFGCLNPSMRKVSSGPPKSASFFALIVSFRMGVLRSLFESAFSTKAAPVSLACLSGFCDRPVFRWRAGTERVKNKDAGDEPTVGLTR